MSFLRHVARGTADRSSSTATCSSSGSSGRRSFRAEVFARWPRSRTSSDAGVPVLMIAGNHDCWGGDVLRGTSASTTSLVRGAATSAGWHAHIEHGDGLRPTEDRRYRLLRHVLRNRLAIRSFRWLHPDLATPPCRRELARESQLLPRATADAAFATRRLESQRANRDRSISIVFGHSHVATLERLPSGAVYANAGSWLDAPTFLAVDRRADRASSVGRISRECGSPRLPSFRRESAALAGETAADRRTQ